MSKDLQKVSPISIKKDSITQTYSVTHKPNPQVPVASTPPSAGTSLSSPSAHETLEKLKRTISHAIDDLSTSTTHTTVAQSASPDLSKSTVLNQSPAHSRTPTPPPDGPRIIIHTHLSDLEDSLSPPLLSPQRDLVDTHTHTTMDKEQIAQDERIAREMADAECQSDPEYYSWYNRRPPGRPHKTFTKNEDFKPRTKPEPPKQQKSRAPFQFWPSEKTSPGVKQAPNQDGNDSDEGEEAKSFKLFAKMFAGEHGVKRAIERVSLCDGTNSDKVLEWVRQMDTVNRAFELAPETCTGPLLEFVRASPATTWPELKENIVFTFISPTFVNTQRDALQTLRQRPGENLLTYIHQFKTIAREAYPEPPRDQTDLVRLFLSSLTDRGIARTVAKKQPPTLQQAVERVCVEAEADGFLRPLPPKTPGRAHAIAPDPTMDRLSRAVESLVQAQTDTVKQHQELVGQVAALSAPKPSPQRRTNKHNKQTSSCFRCGKQGHWSNECKSQPPPIPKQQPLNPAFPTDRCYRCRQPGHAVKDCRTGPPRAPCRCGGRHWLYDCPTKTRARPLN